MIKTILSIFSMKLSHYITNGSINDIEEISHSDSSCDEIDHDEMNESSKCEQQEEVIESKQEEEQNGALYEGKKLRSQVILSLHF